MAIEETAGADDKMTVRQWLPLLGVTCSAFVLNTSEFMPIGLLTDIADSFQISEATAGIMITAYAWAVMLLSLPLMIAASRVEFKRLLVGVLTVFGIGQVLSAVALTYLILTLARIVVASAHAIFWSIASIVATRVVGPKHGALALSVVATGTSIAMIFGLPLGRAIGLMVGWRMTFGVVAVISFSIVAYVLAVFPPLPAGEPFTLAKLPVLLKNKMLVTLYAATVFIATGYYTGYSYIEPFLQQIAGLEPGVITLALTAFGFAGLLGSFLFSRFYDGHRLPLLAVTIGGVAAALLLMAAAAGSLVSVVAVCVLWGACATAFNIGFQSEIIKGVEADSSSVAMSMFSGIFNYGIGAGSAVGGVVVTHVGIGYIGFAGGAIAAAGWLVAVLLLFRYLRAAV